MRRGTPLHRVRYMLVSVVAAASLMSTTQAAHAEQEQTSNAAPQNLVQVINTQNHQLRVDGHVQFNRIPGPTARPLNEAFAYSSCTDCQTFAVALQIDLISKSATDIRPENYAVALNFQCTRCTTVADAYQYVIQVDDPRRVAPELADRVDNLNDRIDEINGEEDLTVSQVQTRINEVIARFQKLALSVTTQSDARENHQHDEQDD